METDILIIGGGLSGLSLADHLNRLGLDWQLMEAQPDLGGRIRSPDIASGRFDLGPAWFWPGQPLMAALTERLSLPVFEQYSRGSLAYEQRDGKVMIDRGYASMQGSLRLDGGMIGLIDGLEKGLPPERIHKQSKVRQLTRRQDRIIAEAEGKTITARRVVLALPARVAAETIRFEPALPAGALEAARAIPTWMAGQAKILAVYDRPHWREAGFSGDAMSQKGPMVEIHDASAARGGPYALFGFVGIQADIRLRHRDEVLRLAHAQLVNLFGPAMAEPLDLRIMDWAGVPEISTALDRQPAFAHPSPGLPTVLQDLWNGTLRFGATETAPGSPGYLEGALEAAEALAQYFARMETEVVRG